MKIMIDFAILIILYISIFYNRWYKSGKCILFINTIMYIYLSFVLYFTLMPLITSLPFIFNHPHVGMNLVPFVDVLNNRGDFIKQIVDIQKNRDKTISPKGITGITVWGISDQTSWRGGCKPLFFTRKSVRVKDETTGKYKTVYSYVPKKSYEAMIEALK